MDHQPTDDRDQRPQPGTPAPAPWERRPPGNIKETLETGEQMYTGEEGEADYLADDQASLHSKLRGGGRDQGEAADEEYTKLCPACRTVTSFVQGVCTSCSYRDGDPLPDLPSSMQGYGSPGVSPAAISGIIAAIVVVVLIVLGFIYGPKLLGRQAGSDGTPAATPGAPQQTAAGNGGYTGGVDPIAVNETFYKRLASVLEEGNTAWETAGRDCYIYRYNVFETTVPATRQDVTITAFLGGKDAAECAQEPGDQAFRQAVQSWIDQQNSHAGVSTIIRLTYKPDGTYPSDEDRYLRYGMWYGKDHWKTLKPIIDSLEAEKSSTGQYPEILSDGHLRGKLQSRGGLTFSAGGVGYLPVFKTDGSGHIIMGQGSGIAAFMPEECTGYYLVFYLQSEKEGLDIYGQTDLKYYRDKIQPFPYQPDEPLTNMKLVPDGKPDGIACVVHSGELVDMRPAKP